MSCRQTTVDRSNRAKTASDARNNSVLALVHLLTRSTECEAINSTEDSEGHFSIRAEAGNNDG